MAANGSSAPDALVLLRSSIASNTLPVPTKTADASSNTETVPLEEATYLIFNTEDFKDGAQHTSVELTAPTRFISQRADAALDLLSVYFCWLNKDTGVGDYIAATQALTEQRSKNGLSGATNLVFAEKLDLVTWLSGEEGESEFIKSLDDTPETRRQARDAAATARGDQDVDMQDGDGGVGVEKGGAREEERMREIYAAERSLGDRNTVLRGSKPTVGHKSTHAKVVISVLTYESCRTSLPCASTPMRSYGVQLPGHRVRHQL